MSSAFGEWVVDYPHVAEEETELTLVKGDVVIAQEEVSADDWVLVHKQGNPSASGYVPGGYLTRVEQPQIQNMEDLSTPVSAPAFTTEQEGFHMEDPPVEPEISPEPEYILTTPVEVVKSPIVQTEEVVSDIPLKIEDLRTTEYTISSKNASDNPFDSLSFRIRALYEHSAMQKSKMDTLYHSNKKLQNRFNKFIEGM
ncbi:hypothetical protein PCE1_004926 [Barthelona sp. PCE]